MSQFVLNYWKICFILFMLLLLLFLINFHDHYCVSGSAGSDRSEQRKGLLDIIARSKNDNQKKAYHCIKCLTTLFTRSRIATSLLADNPDIRKRWAVCVEWLQNELDRVRFHYIF